MITFASANFFFTFSRKSVYFYVVIIVYMLQNISWKFNMPVCFVNS